jgi:hypothetical protein
MNGPSHSVGVPGRCGQCLFFELRLSGSQIGSDCDLSRSQYRVKNRKGTSPANASSTAPAGLVSRPVARLSEYSLWRTRQRA